MDIKFHCFEEENFKREGQMVRAFSYTDYSIDPHNHDFYEMNIVLGGIGIHQIEGAAFLVKKGDVFVIPPMTSHAYYNTEHLEVYHILFRKDFIRNNLLEAQSANGFLQLMEIEPFLRQSFGEAMFLHLNAAQLSEVIRDLKYIEEGETFETSGNLPLVNHTAWKIIYYLSHLLADQIKNGKNSFKKKYHHQIFDVLEYIHQHFSEKITLASLADSFYLSKSTLLRKFRAVCGCSPSAYINQYRVKKALELLEISELSKTEIAHMTGFYDLSHMEKVIKASKE